VLPAGGRREGMPVVEVVPVVADEGAKEEEVEGGEAAATAAAAAAAAAIVSCAGNAKECTQSVSWPARTVVHIYVCGVTPVPPALVGSVLPGSCCCSRAVPSKFPHRVLGSWPMS